MYGFKESLIFTKKFSRGSFIWFDSTIFVVVMGLWLFSTFLTHRSPCWKSMKPLIGFLSYFVGCIVMKCRCSCYTAIFVWQILVMGRRLVSTYLNHRRPCRCLSFEMTCWIFPYLIGCNNRYISYHSALLIIKILKESWHFYIFHVFDISPAAGDIQLMWQSCLMLWKWSSISDWT